MSLKLRAIEPADVPAVARLLAASFPDEPCSMDEWASSVEWMCFPTEFDDGIPRGLVVTGDRGVVAHIGLTVSSFTDGARSVKLVQTVNWTVDRSQGAGPWAVQLLARAASSADAGIIVGGNQEAQAIFPKVGFEKRLDVGRYIKITRPARFLVAPPRPGEGWRQPGKLAVWLARSAVRAGPRADRNASERHPVAFRALDPAAEELDALWKQLRANSGEARQETVMRNTLEPALLRWYARCPRGDVKLIEFRIGDEPVGVASVFLGARGRYPFATILSVDAMTEDPAGWRLVLDGLEDFASQVGVTHINALGSYAPWCDALERSGYARLRWFPLWVRDRSGLLDDVETWHVTAIDGDLGYLLT